MNGFGIRDFGCADDGRHGQIALCRRSRTDTNGLIGQFHVLGLAVGFGVDNHGLDAHFAARTLYAQAISPRLAIRIFSNIGREMPLAREYQSRSSVPMASHFAKLTNNEQGLAEFDRLPVFDQNLTYGATGISVDFIEQFHGFDDAQSVAFLDH